MISRLVDRLTRSAIIMYHRVADVPHDPWGLSVSPDNFAAQLDQLRRSRTVLPMAEFAARALAGTLPRRAVAITFDDGYVDNLEAASPILIDAGLPATLFLATGPTVEHGAYWFEDLAELILDAPSPADFTFQLAGKERRVTFGPREAHDDERGDWRGWEGPHTMREREFCSLWDEIRVLDPAAQLTAIAAIRTELHAPPAQCARPMTPGEAREIVKAGAFTLGGHTRDHADLLALDEEAALAQIVQGKCETEALTGAPITGFAYPFGRHDGRVARLVEAAGFDWACTTEHAHVRRSKPVQPFLLPRIQAEDTPDINWLG